MLTVVGGGIGDPTMVLALGCAFLAALSDGEAEFRETKMISRTSGNRRGRGITG